MTSVLIVEDEESLADPLAFLLRKEGFEATVVADGPSALAEFDRAGADIVLLDLMLPGMSGTDVCKQLRARSSVPVIMVTARDSEIDKVVGLELGADDYLAKPFNPHELLARIRSVGRRSAAGASPAVTPASETNAADAIAFDNFVLDRQRRELRDRSGNPITLTTGEYELLLVLLEQAGHILSRDQLLQKTHHRDAGPFDRTIDVQIGRLRKKLGDNGKEPRLIKYVRGAGYMLATTPHKR